jgi:predicted ATP-dependent endonuclease of OLD family
MNPQQYYGGQFGGESYTPQSGKKSIFKNKRALILIVFITLVALTALAGVFSVTSQDRPTKVMTLIFTKKDASAAYEALGSYMQERETKQDWVTEVNSYAKLYSGFKLDRKKVEKEDGITRTYYIYSLTIADSKSTDIAATTITVEKGKDGKEQIKNFDIRRSKK